MRVLKKLMSGWAAIRRHSGLRIVSARIVEEPLLRDQVERRVEFRGSVLLIRQNAQLLLFLQRRWGCMLLSRLWPPQAGGVSRP